MLDGGADVERRRSWPRNKNNNKLSGNKISISNRHAGMRTHNSHAHYIETLNMNRISNPSFRDRRSTICKLKEKRGKKTNAKMPDTVSVSLTSDIAAVRNTKRKNLKISKFTSFVWPNKPHYPSDSIASNELNLIFPLPVRRRSDVVFGSFENSTRADWCHQWCYLNYLSCLV